MKKFLAILLVLVAFHVAMPNFSSSMNCDGTDKLGKDMVLDTGRDCEPPDCDVCNATGKCQKCKGSGKVR